MPTPINKTKFNLKENLKDKFVAYIDVMGFSNLVNKGSSENLDAYFSKITDELEKLKKEKVKIQSFLISDSIILISPDGLSGFKQIVIAVRRIQSALLWRKVLLRGAISFGQVYYNPIHNIVVGKGFIKAYLLEQEAIYPRVIIDPSIIKKISDDKIGFLKLVNQSEKYNFRNRLIYSGSDFSKIAEDGIFVDYATRTVQENELNGNIKMIYQTIVENLYTEQKLYSKYIWLRDYFLESLRLTNSLVAPDTNEEKAHKKNLNDWILKFERL